MSSRVTAHKSSKQAITKTWFNLNPPEIAALIIGYLYVTGYYIDSVFIGNLGISHKELFRLEYIKIGFTFTLITLGLVFLPFGSFYLTYKVRRTSQLPHFHQGAIGNALNTTFALAFPLFLAFFATNYEWQLTLPVPLLGMKKFMAVALTSQFLLMTGMILVPSLERLVAARVSAPWRSRLFYFVIEPIRYGIFIVSLFLIIRLLLQIPWTVPLLLRGFPYYLTSLVLASGPPLVALWMRQIKKVQEAWLVYPLISFPVACLYFLAVTSYVFGVYAFIPINRGGRLPLTQAFFKFKSNDTILANELTIRSMKLHGPVYIIEETDDSYYVASEKMEGWLYEFAPIHVIRKENVPYIYLQRIDNGFPRISTFHPTPSIRRAKIMFPQEFYQARRVFQYDYIYFDALLLVVWLFILWKNKEYKALLFGAVIAPIIYTIDAVAWWNTSAGPAFPPGTYIREYWIGGLQMTHPLGSYFWLKFGADFMMTISYSFYTFPWLWIVFRNLRQGKVLSKQVLQYTLLWLGIWLLVPLLSITVPLDDRKVETVRHMNTQLGFWITNIALGYSLLLIVYRKNLKVVLRLLAIGIIGSLIMELPLYLFRIRPTGLGFLLFEGFILLNQGVPYLYLLADKILPFIQHKALVNSDS